MNIFFQRLRLLYNTLKNFVKSTLNFLPKHLCASYNSFWWDILVFLTAKADGSKMS